MFHSGHWLSDRSGRSAKFHNIGFSGWTTSCWIRSVERGTRKECLTDEPICVGLKIICNQNRRHNTGLEFWG